MNEITIPYHLAIPSILCMIALTAIIFNRKKLFSKNKPLWTSITTFLVLYLLVVGTATFLEIYYQWDLNRYDLDKDGIFAGAEITDAQDEAMRRLTNDTGRNFSLITGFFFASIVSAAVYLLAGIVFRLKKQ